MENEGTNETLLDDLPPGGQTRFSSVFGAIGNYAMIGTLGAVAIKQVHKIYTKDPHALKFDKITAVGAGLVGALSLAGIVHGQKEADNIQNYREAVANKVDYMGREIRANRQKIEELTRKVHEKAEGHGQAHPR